MASPREVRLQSVPMFNTPGVLRWAANKYRFKDDRAALRRMFVEGFPHPTLTKRQWDRVIHRLLMGETPYTVEPDNTVVFTY